MTLICLIYAFFEDLFLFVPNSLFIADFFDRDSAFFSWDSLNCFLWGEAVNSFAHLALDCFAWSMEAEHFGVRWGMGRTSAGLTNFPPPALWKKILMFPFLKFHCQLHQYVYLEIRHSMACEFMILECVSVTRREYSFYK